ncbi:MAG TPA: GyrI-like domain-containing protein [Chthonomonadaceae bacterium]|nr:GyrI-like domain-containing protein [Chthonomonadaceae bacterium]
MIEPPQVVETVAEHNAHVHLTIPREEIATVMRPGLQQVISALMEQDVEPAGPWYTHHLRMRPDTFDFEICVPVAAPIEPSAGVEPGELRAATVARTVYHGAYEGLGAAWAELMEWIQAHGHAPAEDLWERYLVGPESSPNPDDWRTELNRPLARIV